MADYDWTKFTLRENIKAAKERIYDAIATRQGMESWFLRMAEFTKPDNSLRSPGEYIAEGDSYRWNWYGWSADMVEKGKIIRANGKDSIQFTFVEGKCTVLFTVKTEQGETILEVVQENIPTDEKSKVDWHLGCSNGWTFYLANLKSILEGGIDLRNKNEKLKSMVNS